MDQIRVDNLPTAIAVNKLTDRIEARRQVREEARNANFGLMEQAKISMAIYDVISRIDLGTSCFGEVAVNRMNDGCRSGMQVICTAKNRIFPNLTPASFNEYAWMVDELNVEMVTGDTRIIIVIWAG